MNAMKITSLEQVPAGITALFERLAALETRIMEREEVKELPQEKREEYLTRNQVAARLQISLPTLNELTKNGKLKGYRVSGNRVRYKLSDIESVLTEIKTC